MRREEMKMRSGERFSPPFIVKEIFAASRSGSTICRKSFFPAPSPPKGFTITISFLGRPVWHDLQQQPFVTHTHIAVGKKNQVLLLYCFLSQELLSKISTLLSFSRDSFKDGDDAHNARCSEAMTTIFRTTRLPGFILDHQGVFFLLLLVLLLGFARKERQTDRQTEWRNAS